MATITQNLSGRYRARIRRKGYKNIQKTFGEQSEAETWARAVEMTIEGERSIQHEPGMVLSQAKIEVAEVGPQHEARASTIEMASALPRLQWLVWDTKEAVSVHPEVKDCYGCDQASLMIIEFENGVVRVASTTNPLTMLRSNIQLSATWGSPISHILVSKPLAGLNRGCVILCKRLLVAGYQTMGQRIFKGISVPAILRTLRLTYPDMDEPVPSQSVVQFSRAVAEKVGAEDAAPVQAIAVRSVPRIAILGTDIRKDADGRYCLNDLHRASGGNNAHRPSLWVENKQTKELIAEILKAGIPALTSIKGGRHNGTYVCKELVYAYAMWVSPRFHLTVIRAFDAMVTNKPVEQVVEPTVQDAIDERAWRIASDERDRLLSLLGSDAEDDIWKIAIRIKRRVRDELSSLARSFGPSACESSMLAVAKWSPNALNSRRDG
jgi:hypothetical protein